MAGELPVYQSVSKRLRSLTMVVFCLPEYIEEELKDFGVDSQLHGAPLGMTWLGALAELRNLSSLQIKIKRMVECDDGWFGLHEVRADAIVALQGYLQSMVCQPRAVGP